MKGVLCCFGVSRVYDNLGRTNDVHIHLHSHLEEEELRVSLQAVYLQYLGIVCVVYAHPEVRLHTCRELAEHDGVVRNTHDRHDLLTLEAVTVNLGILRVLNLLVRDILVVCIPRIPADDKDE